MKIHGMTDMCLEIEDILYRMFTIVVEEIDVDMILELDFLQSHKVTVTVVHDIMILQGKSY